MSGGQVSRELGATGRWASVMCLLAYSLLAISIFMYEGMALLTQTLERGREPGAPGVLAVLVVCTAIGLSFRGARSEGEGPHRLRRAIALSALVVIPLTLLTPPGMIIGGSVIVGAIVAPILVFVGLATGVRPLWLALLLLVSPVLFWIAGPLLFVFAHSPG